MIRWGSYFLEETKKERKSNDQFKQELKWQRLTSERTLKKQSQV